MFLWALSCSDNTHCQYLKPPISLQLHKCISKRIVKDIVHALLCLVLPLEFCFWTTFPLHDVYKLYAESQQV